MNEEFAVRKVVQRLTGIFMVGDKVRKIGGPKKGYEGFIFKIQGNSIFVSVTKESDDRMRIVGEDGSDESKFYELIP